MPVIRVDVQGTRLEDVDLAFGPDLRLEGLLGELEDWAVTDRPVLVDAYGALADATIVEAACHLHRCDAPVVLRVKSPAVQRRVLRALPGSGGRASIPVAHGRTVVVAEGSIVSMPVDALVNASNRMLQLGAGVSGAIARAARPSLQEEMTNIAGRDGLPAGHAVLTGPHGIGGIRGIIHVNAVSGDPEDVRAATAAALRAAEEAGFRSVAVPLLGTGTGGLEAEVGVAVLGEVCQAWAQRDAGVLTEVWVAVWSDEVYGLARRFLEPALSSLPV
jgi:O-acetyl-ADP-ribose deacetylase (regulator of RNase III)